MKTKLIYFILFVVAAIVLTGAAFTSVYGSGTLTKTLVSPSNNIEFVGDQFVFNFTGASSMPVAKIVIGMPPYTTVYQAQTVVASQGFVTGTTFKVTNNAPSGLILKPIVTVTLNINQTLQKKNISLFIAKFVNPPSTGTQTVWIATETNSSVVIDNGTGIFSPKIPPSASITDTGTLDYTNGNPIPGNVGIATTSPQNRLEVNGSIGISGNIVSDGLSGTNLKIKGPTGGGICIGNGC